MPSSVGRARATANGQHEAGMSTYYVGIKFGQEDNPDNVVAGTSTAGTAVDYELRMETGNGGTRQGAILAMIQFAQFINGGGQGPGGGANLPPT
jgi:hypothetical protein